MPPRDAPSDGRLPATITLLFSICLIQKHAKLPKTQKKNHIHEPTKKKTQAPEFLNCFIKSNFCTSKSKNCVNAKNTKRRGIPGAAKGPGDGHLPATITFFELFVHALGTRHADRSHDANAATGPEIPASERYSGVRGTLTPSKH